MARRGHPSLVGMRAMSPRHTLFLFRAENSPFKTLAPLSEAFPPLPCFLGPLQDASPFLVIMRRAVLPFATMPILRSSMTIRPGPYLRLSAQRMSPDERLQRLVCHLPR